MLQDILKSQDTQIVIRVQLAGRNQTYMDSAGRIILDFNPWSKGTVRAAVEIGHWLAGKVLNRSEASRPRRCSGRVEALWLEVGRVDRVDLDAGWPFIDPGGERRSRREAAGQAALPLASRWAASITSFGDDVNRSTGRAWFGSQPLFDVN